MTDACRAEQSMVGIVAWSNQVCVYRLPEYADCFESIAVLWDQDLAGTVVLEVTPDKWEAERDALLSAPDITVATFGF
jgi:hypothetical protein